MSEGCVVCYIFLRFRLCSLLHFCCVSARVVCYIFANDDDDDDDSDDDNSNLPLLMMVTMTIVMISDE